jgi:hypothetical protein
MTKSECKAMARLRAQVKRQGRLLVELARVLHTHVRTDLPPDACLPRMGRLLKRIRGAQ